MNSVELPKSDKLVKVYIDLLEPASRLCPYIEDKDVACVVIPMGRLCKLSRSGYPGRYESIEIILVGWTFSRVVRDNDVKLKTAFNVVEKLMKAFALLKRSTDITMLLGSRIKSAQVLDDPWIGYLIIICIGNSVWSGSCNLRYDERSLPSGI